MNTIDHDNITVRYTSEGLQFYPVDMKPWRVDFLSPEKNHRRTYGGTEILVKACGIKKNQISEPTTILDLTAGFAKDSFILACAGARVILVERHPIVVALLEDGLKRFYANPDASKNIDLTLYFDEAEHFLKEKLSIVLPNLPDVIYIDPMHPERQKSAQVKKDMQILQQYLQIPPENNPEYLVNLSLSYAKKRVVLKWPKKSPPLKKIKPAFVYEENTVRFEVYIP